MEMRLVAQPLISHLSRLKLKLMEAYTGGQRFLWYLDMSYCLAKKLKQRNEGCSSETEHSAIMVMALGSIPIPLGKQGFVGIQIKGSCFLGFSHIGSTRKA